MGPLLERLKLKHKKLNVAEAGIEPAVDESNVFTEHL